METGKKRQRDRLTDRQTDKTDRQTDKTDRQRRKREIKTETDRQTDSAGSINAVIGRDIRQ